MTDDLKELVAWAKAHVDAMTPEQRDAMFEEQRRALRQSLRDYPERETRVVIYQHGSQEGPMPYGASGAGILPPTAPEPFQPDYRAILVSLCASLHRCEGAGDMMENAARALTLAGIVPPDGIDSDDVVADWLKAKEGAGCLWTMKAPTDRRD